MHVIYAWLVYSVVCAWQSTSHSQNRPNSTRACMYVCTSRDEQSPLVHSAVPVESCYTRRLFSRLFWWMFQPPAVGA